MKIIFLDIDGVLNHQHTKERIHGCLGIDPIRVNRLAKIVKETGAQVVLTSTWKMDWKPCTDSSELNVYGQYMVNALLQEDIHIFDKTVDDGMNRGEGILTWLNNYPVESFVILDDELFDYRKCELLPHVVKSTFYEADGGLCDIHVSQAIQILNGGVL